MGLSLKEIIQKVLEKEGAAKRRTQWLTNEVKQILGQKPTLKRDEIFYAVYEAQLERGWVNGKLVRPATRNNLEPSTVEQAIEAAKKKDPMLAELMKKELEKMRKMKALDARRHF